MNQTKMAVKMGVLALAIGGTGLAHAVDGTATATVVTPVTVTQSQELNFGQFAAGAGTVVIASDGTMSVTGNVIKMSSSTGQQAGQFTITGEGNNNIGITVSGTAVLSDGAATPNTMSVAIAPQATLPTALTGGSATINVGGTLTVLATTPSGTYTTTNTGGSAYTVTVNYN